MARHAYIEEGIIKAIWESSIEGEYADMPIVGDNKNIGDFYYEGGKVTAEQKMRADIDYLAAMQGVTL